MPDGLPWPPQYPPCSAKRMVRAPSPREDFVGADIAIEHVANPSVAEVHDVVVAAVAGKIDLSHGVGRERHRAAFLARALFIGVAPSPLPADSCRHRTAAVLPEPGSARFRPRARRG
jgi:hypothetical protein